MLRVLNARHKSASMWARSIFAEAAAATKLSTLAIYTDEQWKDHGTLGDLVRDENPDILVLTNAHQKDLDTLPENRQIHLIRDPRDIVVSGYFSHRNSHATKIGDVVWPELIEHRQRLLELDESAGLMEEIEFSGYFLDPLSGWNHDNPNVLQVKMEELIAAPQEHWLAMLDHFQMLGPASGARMTAVRWNVADRRGEPKAFAWLRKGLPKLSISTVPPAYVPFALQRFTFSKMAGSARMVGQVDENSHYRKGVAGDWVNHLTEAHLEVFYRRYPGLVERFGYEV